METTRQQKISRQIQRDIADIFQKEAAAIMRGAMVTVTTVRVSPDFGYAKIYVSVFPFEKSAEIIEALKSAGCDTAKSVLELSVEEIAHRADLEVEQAEQVVAILKAEFE